MAEVIHRYLNRKIYIATVAEKARETALQYGLGLECDEFCTAVNLEDAKYIRQATETMQGISRRVLHAPFSELCPAAIDPEVRRISRCRYEQAWRMAQRMGISRMVIHTGFIPLVYFPEWFIEQSVKFWKEFLEGKPEGCEFLLENVMDEDPKVQAEIIRQVNDPRLRLCLDVGHAHFCCRKTGDTVETWIRTWAPWLSHLHLHNNDQSWDTHSALGDGTIPMDQTLQLLEELAPQATWTIEALDAEKSCRWLLDRGWIEERKA